MAMTIQKPTGLLLCGGGAKGAFQIGALERLAECGMLTDVTALAGCSVGALNMVLYALSVMGGDPGLGRRIWMQIRAEDLLSNTNDASAMFSRDGLIRLLHQLPLELIGTSQLRMYVSTMNVRAMRTEYHRLNGLPKERICTLLLASSALPAAYPPVPYQNGLYMDGGLTMDGYLCIQPLYADGHRNLLMISHDSELSLYGVQDSRFVRKGRTDLTQTYADCDFTLIKPRTPLGGLIRGTLNFSPESIASRMTQGREDTDAILRGDTSDSDSIAAVNEGISATMQRLFPNAAKLREFVRSYSDCFEMNIPFQTMGGKVWYNDIFAVDGWRVQHHRTAGLRGHYRILDADGVRQAWILEAQVLINALRRFEAEKRLESLEDYLRLNVHE